MKKKIRVALVHDYLREYGGAERVLEALHSMFPDAPVYTAFFDSNALKEHAQRFKDWDIHESVAARMPFIHTIYSPLRVLSSFFFEGFDLSSFDVVISSTNMYMAKAVLTQPKTAHICYCHTPPRSLYGYTTGTDWKKNIFSRLYGECINVYMRHIDYLTAQRPDVIVANSIETQSRIKKFYRRDSVLIYPPVELPLTPVSMQIQGKGDYFLYVNRLAYSKHPELAVEVCTKLRLPLKVVGRGKMEEKLKSIAGDTIEFLGGVSDQELVNLYAGARALLYPVEDEDFGIVPVEAMLLGTPIIAHNSGGPKETISNGVTGIFIDELTTLSLEKAIEEFEKLKFDRAAIKKHAERFSLMTFERKMRNLIELEVEKKQQLL